MRENSNKIRKEGGDITTDASKRKQIIRDYYEQLHVNKSDNLEKIGKFL